MKKLLFSVICISLTACSGAAQTPTTQGISAPKESLTVQAPNPKTAAEIPADEWNEIIKTIESEDWEKSSFLTLYSLKKLRTDNEKKQLARLRYFYVYSLAGKIAQKTMPATELERISQAFIGQDFLMPSRQILSDCTEKVNYICAVKADEKSLRVTATNKSATAIHSFEYVKLPEKFDITASSGREVFLGGKLKKLEVGTYKNDIKIVKLYFENGYADIVKR